MYWPVGAPKIYAASNHELARAAKLDDKPDHPSETESAVLPVDGADEDGENTENGNAGSKKSRVRSKKSRTSDASSKSVDLLALKRDEHVGGEIVGVRLGRNGHLFATITRCTLTVWQTKPTTVVASVLRSASSIKSYGDNCDVLLRPGGSIVVVQTTLGYLITYSLATDPSAHLYNASLTSTLGHSRRRTIAAKQPFPDPFCGPGEGHGIKEVSIKFRMVIKVDAGISKALALDDELVVATEKPPALQCVRWVPGPSGNQASTTLLKSLSWISKKAFVVDMVHDRPMNISTWITSDGRCYAVQNTGDEEGSNVFRGHCFHVPEKDGDLAAKAAISARFSLIAIGCQDSAILVYTAKDYAGHIPLSHTLMPPVSPASAGSITCMTYSPDGYSLFVGYENGWAMWSVYGKLGATSFISDRATSLVDDERWLLGVKDAFWIGSGSEIVLLAPLDNRLWSLSMARSAVAGCFSSANVARSLLQTPSGFMIYRGYDLPDLGTISLETGLWNNVQIPADYLHRQWPIRCSVISTDGRYVAVAGRRGLAHYSVASGRWKAFNHLKEDEFTVRGGMCWHQHVLIAAVESNEGFEIRVYSREADLDSVMDVQSISAPIVHLAPSGQDSLLVYTYENHLYHYVINVSNASVRLVQVGQIALHGIIRAPPRVRALSWILPEDQLGMCVNLGATSADVPENGDPSQDVSIATILFLVDGKLVSLQPSTKENGELKYDMRILAQNVEYYVLMRDQQNFDTTNQAPPVPEETGTPRLHQSDLRDSLWYFDGVDIKLWTDAQELFAAAPPDLGQELPVSVSIPIDFYPLSVLLNKGILFGIEPDLTQRRDVGFAILRFVTRTQLFIPQVLRHHLQQANEKSALFLARRYSRLEYFAHALEVLLHDVLDAEVDGGGGSGDAPATAPRPSLLPAAVALLAAFPPFLDVVVQCTRKTDVRSWRTLFDHLPPARRLFELALDQGRLKTAAGYLLVLHNLDERAEGGGGAAAEGGEQGDGELVSRLLRRAADVEDWELCKELARFLVALDKSGETLRRALRVVGLVPGEGESDDFEVEDNANGVAE